MTATGLPVMTDSQQQELGKVLLTCLWANNLRVDGVHVEFEEVGL